MPRPTRLSVPLDVVVSEVVHPLLRPEKGENAASVGALVTSCALRVLSIAGRLLLVLGPQFPEREGVRGWRRIRLE